MRGRIGRLLLAAMAACGIGGTARADDITFWTWRQEDKAAWTQFFADFTKANPDIHVSFEAFAPENYATIVSTALAGGKGGDVLQTKAYGGLEQFAKAGYLLPLDPATVPELGNMSADALKSETLRSDGRVYSLPSASQTLGLLINKDAFAKAGVQPPTTWAELADVSKALKAKGIIPIANGTATGWMDEVFAGLFTGPVLGRGFTDQVVTGKTNFAGPAYVDALGRLQTLRDAMPPGFTGIDYPTAQQLFLTGRAAIFAGGSFEIANFRKQNPKLDLDFIAPPAVNPGDPRPVTVYFDGGYAVNAKSAHQASALKLVRWLGTKEFGDKFTAALGNVSPVKGVVSSDPLINKVTALDEVSVPYVMLAYFRYDTPTGSELLQAGMQKLMAGSATPQQVGTEINDGIARYYKPFQK